MLRNFFFLWLFTVCGLWGTRAQYEPSLLDQIATHQQQWFRYTAGKQTEDLEKLDRIKEALVGQLDALHMKTEIELKALRDAMKSQKGVVEQEPENSSNPSLKRISQPPPKPFEKIGRRYFYIESHGKLNWYGASNKCRRFGGHLATIKDSTELQKIKQKLDSDIAYWIDINSNRNIKTFVSSLTGKPAPYFSWASKRPKYDHKHCVALKSGEMYDNSCDDENYLFICQSEQSD
ncbi:accessory gland protein Acp29AB-like [Drosophila ficusphila]|uniref:accessory gland protein Acp29AB-like n=1 Tax=Drosophila ficusphila TaxID=30025 RepID=UPI001C8A49D4|nr:accessory gland protein Acp29AB-like [Drosophila ficusphila]